LERAEVLRPDILIVAAVAENGVIGKDDLMPWHLPNDFRRLAKLAMGKPLIMGRKTFESLPDLQRGRRHNVITRNEDWSSAGVEVARSLDHAFAVANSPEVAIFGGVQVYAQALPLASRIELTQVHATVEGDALMQPLGDNWTETWREEFEAEGGNPAYAFVTLVRR
jgi:dihydrofolate reductase